MDNTCYAHKKQITSQCNDGFRWLYGCKNQEFSAQSQKGKKGHFATVCLFFSNFYTESHFPIISLNINFREFFNQDFKAMNKAMKHLKNQ